MAPKLARVWPEFLEWIQKLWNLDYELQYTSGSVVKFSGDRPRKLENLAQKRTSAVKHNRVFTRSSKLPANVQHYICWKFNILQLKTDFNRSNVDLLGSINHPHRGVKFGYSNDALLLLSSPILYVVTPMLSRVTWALFS